MRKMIPMMRTMFSYIRIGITVKVCIAFILTIFIVSTLLLSSYSEGINRGLSNNLIRLHVVANSDSPEDQAFKREVRDKILDYMKVLLRDSKSIGQSGLIIKNNLDNIEALVNSEIKVLGKDLTSSVSLGSYPFPTKAYGDITLPAGNYQALRVVLGKGMGANWWCVIFPPLCFVDVTHGSFPEASKDDLKKALTDEEYSIVASASSDEEIPVKIKFKIVEFFQDSKIKFAGLFTKLFNAPK